MPNRETTVQGSRTTPLLAMLALVLPLSVTTACSGDTPSDETTAPSTTETAQATPSSTAASTTAPPATDVPVTDVPVTDVPATDVPLTPTDVPATDVPVTPTADPGTPVSGTPTAASGTATPLSTTPTAAGATPTAASGTPTVASGTPTADLGTGTEAPTVIQVTDPLDTPTDAEPTDVPPTPTDDLETSDPDTPTDPEPTPPPPTPTEDDATVDETTPTEAGDTPTVGEDSLYNRLGQEEGITVVVQDFVVRLVGDSAVNGYFLNSSVDGGRLERCLIKQVGNLSGGPQVYPDEPGTGDGCRNMADSHAGMGISTADYNDLSTHFVEALADAGVSDSDIAIFASVFDDDNFKGDIIEDAEDNLTIYQRMGRRPEIESVVSTAITGIVADTEINAFFSSADADRLGTCLVRQLCSVDGPCKYGQGTEEELDGTPCTSMANSHSEVTNPDSGAGIVLEDFNAVVGHFDIALTGSATSAEDREAIIQVLSGMCEDIVADADECGGGNPDVTPPPPPDALIISQYIEGGSSNKAIELANSTGSDVDLSEYSMKLAANGASFADVSEVALSGTLANDEAYVIANSGSSEDILAVADLLNNSIANFNGDDAVGLYKNGVLIDMFGQEGERPDGGWDVAGVAAATKDHSLIRKLETTRGSVDWDESAGTDSDDSQWIVLDKDDFTNLGDHPYFP